jgi:hypothetical protein
MDSGPAPRGASRNDEKKMPSSRHTSAFSRHAAPELCKFNDPQERAQATLKRGRRRPSREGAGKTGCALHPRSRVQGVERDAHEHTGSAEAVRPSLRNGFTAYFVLSLATGFVATIISEKLASQKLDASIGASGPHDLAVRITRCSSKAHPRPPHPTPRP